MRISLTKTRGITLIELLVVMVVLSILAGVALPYAQITLQRNKELELRRSLREVREAIDAFHADWLAGRIARTDDAASADGYPASLEVLVSGVERADASAGMRYYLRRIPRDPFAEQGRDIADHWMLRSYQDRPDNRIWGAQDVYDLRSKTQAGALDGSLYADW